MQQRAIAAAAVVLTGCLVSTAAHAACDDPGPDPPSCMGMPATCLVPPGGAPFFATDGDDVIVGTDGRDVIFAQAGNDTVCSLDGNDKVHGDAGNDTIDAGPGNDKVYGGIGQDALIGGEGNDELYGGADGDDLEGGYGADLLCGRAGDDTLVGGPGPDVLKGGADNDTLDGGGSSDVLSGGPQRDVLDGGEGTDTLIGNAGMDRFVLDNEDARLDGGRNRDTADFSQLKPGLLAAIDGVEIDLGAQTVGGASMLESIVDIEDVFGTPFDDVIIGNAKSNLLHGGGGNDRLRGKAKRDTLIGGAGVDHAHGGPGIDACAAETEIVCETDFGLVWELSGVEPAGSIGLVGCVEDACTGSMTPAGSFKLDYVTTLGNDPNMQRFSVEWRPPPPILVPGVAARLRSSGKAGGSGPTPFRITFCYDSTTATIFGDNAQTEAELCTVIANNVEGVGMSDLDEPLLSVPAPGEVGETLRIDARVNFWDKFTYVYTAREE
jgi:hypothetical protein